MSDFLASRLINLGVTINGMPVAGAERLELIQSGAFSADRFIISMATTPGSSAAFYAGLGQALIVISVGIETSDVSGGLVLLTGQVDNIAVDFGLGVATLSGRDLSARLIDAEVNDSFANQTASDIAAYFAQAAGLLPNVVQTSTPVGQYYEIAHTRTALSLHSRNATQWDLLAALAEIESYTLSVTGTILNFGPPLQQAAPTVLTYGRDLTALMVDRALSLVAPRITIKSWNTRLKKTHSSSQGTGISTTLVKPNLMPGQALSLAQAKQAELTAQAVLLRAAMPGETSLVPQSWINLQGTNSSLDGPYVVQRIERHIDVRGGFAQTFEAFSAA